MGSRWFRRSGLARSHGIQSDVTAASGDVLRFVDGSEFRITKGAADTNGENLEMEWWLPPSTETPPKHIHPRQREDYEVLEGAFEVFVRDGWHTVAAGESASAPVGEVHTFRVGDRAVRVRNVHAPALDFEDYFAAESALMEAGRSGAIRARGPSCTTRCCSTSTATAW